MINEIQVKYTDKNGRPGEIVLDFKSSSNLGMLSTGSLITALAARGSCLKLINRLFQNLPTVNDWEFDHCVWLGRDAEFIYFNLWNIWANNPEFRETWQRRILS